MSETSLCDINRAIDRVYKSQRRFIVRMKIRKIKYNNHPVLGNLELDLVNHITGQPYDTIILAGENGSGKTTILSSLNTFLCLGSFEYFDSIEYEVNGQHYMAKQTGDGNDAKYGFYDRIDLQSNVTERIHSNKNNGRDRIEADTFDIRHNGCVYSKARANFSVRAIKGTTSMDVDNDRYDRDDQEDFSSLKQLIIDIQETDNEKLRDQMVHSPEQEFRYTDIEPSTKMYRFKQAFDHFFETIKYDGVVTKDGEKIVQFNKHDSKVTIDKLSTGEKQIVYRGAFLLRNVGRLDGATIMIDEPELSMHPKWQNKILCYFKDLFKDDNGTQKAQMFFATHSEYVVGEALNDGANTLVIVLSDNEGTIEKNEVRTPLVLPTITASEINYAAFDVPSIDYHIALYGAIQTKYNKHSISCCDDFIHTQCQPVYIDATHGFITNYNGNTYHTLPTKIRNHIDHPDNPYTFTEDELKTSIQLMRDILLNVRITP